MSFVMDHVDALPKQFRASDAASTWSLGDYEARRIPLGKTKFVNPLLIEHD